MSKWFELRTTMDDGDEERTIVERFGYKDEDASMLAAKGMMVARVAVTRAVVPHAKFRAYVVSRELLDWVD